MEETLGKGERQVLILNNLNLTKHLKSLNAYFFALFCICMQLAVCIHETDLAKSFKRPQKMKIHNRSKKNLPLTYKIKKL